MSDRRMLIGSALYVAMAIAAAGIAGWRGAPLFGAEPAVAALGGPLPSLALGLGLATLTVLATRTLTERTAWARALRTEFRSLLWGARPLDVVVLALASGTAEELLFRGALQPWWGLVPASLAFGLVHVGPRRVFLPWTLWALVLGGALGALVWATGSIVGAIVAHVVINAVNLHHILAFDGGLDGGERGEAPTMRLVGTERRRMVSGDRVVR